MNLCKHWKELIHLHKQLWVASNTLMDKLKCTIKEGVFFCNTDLFSDLVYPNIPFIVIFNISTKRIPNLIFYFDDWFKCNTYKLVWGRNIVAAGCGKKMYILCFMVGKKWDNLEDRIKMFIVFEIESIKYLALL